MPQILVDEASWADLTALLWLAHGRLETLNARNQKLERDNEMLGVTNASLRNTLDKARHRSKSLAELLGKL